MNSADLIDALLRRSEDALDQLKLHYGPLIHYVIAPILTDERDRDEAMSDVLLRVWNRIGQFDPEQGSWTSWLSAIARNAAIDRARKNAAVGSELTEDIPAPNADPEKALLRKERQRALHIALNALEQSDRALFYRKYYFRQSTAQIAAEYGTSERAIEGRLYRIKKKLRKALGGEFHDG